MVKGNKLLVVFSLTFGHVLFWIFVFALINVREALGKSAWDLEFHPLAAALDDPFHDIVTLAEEVQRR